MDYYVSALKNYATFSGRARRKEYWMFTLVNVLISIVLSILSMLLPVLGILSIIYSLAIIIPSFAVNVRRLHDIEKSGWWVLISLVPIIGGIVLLVFACTEGTQGPNQYGEDPKNEFGTQM
jgi:uncharacterized membrane protein YhaH (DUF805 family)